MKDSIRDLRLLCAVRHSTHKPLKRKTLLLMGSIDDGRPFVLQDVPGKGKGLIATENIEPGTLILAEEPLFTTGSLSDPATIEKDLGAIVRSLPKESQRAFLSLHNNNPGLEPFSNIVRSNAYPLGPSSEVGGLFPLVARINHSCRPNAQHVWLNHKAREAVHAVRKISKGDELTLSYSNGGPSQPRREALKTYFGFDCQCELCSLPASELAASDERLQKAKELDEAVGDPKTVKLRPEKALADCRELFTIYEDEEIYDLRVPRLWYDGFQIAAMHSDQARASAFAQKCIEARTVCEGEDSEEVQRLRELSKSPKKFENFGATRKWQSKVDDVPKDADAEGFRQWLWKDLPRR